MSCRSAETAKSVIFLTLYAIVTIIVLVSDLVIGIVMLGGIVIPVGLYYIIKWAVKAALSESHFKLERESAEEAKQVRQPSFFVLQLFAV